MAERVEPSRPTWVESAIGLLAVVGLADALLMTFEHYEAINLPCSLVEGCEVVLASSWASIGPFPTAGLGVGFFGALIFMVIYAFSNQRSLPRRATLFWSSLGLAGTAALGSVQAFFIQAWCLYCLMAGLVAVLIFAVALIAWRSDQGEPEQIIVEEDDYDEEA